MKITWFGHSAFRIDFEKSSILVDPFIAENPAAKDLNRNAVLDGVTHIALTHGHSDHIGDSIVFSREKNIPIITSPEVATWLYRHGAEKIDVGNTGGSIEYEDFKLSFVPAVHSSSMVTEDNRVETLGNPNGLIFKPNVGLSVYHMGDTDIFSDMSLIEEIYRPDIGLIPVGDRFTMGGTVAALACKRFFRFKHVFPCHYGTFPVLDPTPIKLVDGLRGTDIKVHVLPIGGVKDFEKMPCEYSSSLR